MSWTVERLRWSDEPLGEIALPKARMRLRAGFGSGLATRPGDPAGTVWAVGDRGPNLKVKPAIRLYGLDRLETLREVDGAKIMPRPDLGPAIAELRVSGDRVELVQACASPTRSASRSPACRSRAEPMRSASPPTTSTAIPCHPIRRASTAKASPRFRTAASGSATNMARRWSGSGPTAGC